MTNLVMMHFAVDMGAVKGLIPLIFSETHLVAEAIVEDLVAFLKTFSEEALRKTQMKAQGVQT